MKPEIRSVNTEELREFFHIYGEKSFRVNQVEEWLWQKCVNSFDEMTNLSKSVRELLKQNFDINPLTIKDKFKSKDHTIKTVFQLFDGHLIEGVLIPSLDRTTACISTQAGCNLACSFCATGEIKLKRNLSTGEIFDQVVELMKQSESLNQKRLSNIVIMGMGEPLMNYDNLSAAIEKITSENGLGFSPQRITLSTVGIAKMIRKLADEKVKFNLAVSLHAANNELRDKLIPANKLNNLEKLNSSIQYFHEQTNSRVTIEYILLKDINDSMKDAAELALFCRSFPCKINIIEYNLVEGSSYKPSLPDKVEQFVDYLRNRNMVINVRESRGADINAACGQLANKHI